MTIKTLSTRYSHQSHAVLINIYDGSVADDILWIYEMITGLFAATQCAIRVEGGEYWGSKRRHCRVLEFCVICIHIIVVVVGICFPYGLYSPSPPKKNFFLSFFTRPSASTDSYKQSTTPVGPMLWTTVEIPFVPEPIAKDIFRSCLRTIRDARRQFCRP